MLSGIMCSPLDAIQQINSTLSTYMILHPDPKLGWYDKAEAGQKAFKLAFPDSQKHSLDDIKKYVLETLAPTFVHFGQWLLWSKGASSLRADLEAKANNWPSHQAYLEHTLEATQKALSDMQLPQPSPSEEVSVDEDESKIADLLAQLEQLKVANDEKGSKAVELEAQLERLKDEKKQKDAEYQLQLENLRTVNYALVMRLKETPAANAVASSSADPEAEKQSPKRAAKK